VKIIVLFLKKMSRGLTGVLASSTYLMDIYF
jgi:hypothetical protein